MNSAALLLCSSENGVANRSGAVGRHFMNHNCSAVLAIDPRTVNDSVYQKTLGVNDFYLDDGRGGPPLGNIQLLGRVTAPILKAGIPQAPEWALDLMSRRSVDWYAMSEDLPSPESRVTVEAGGSGSTGGAATGALMRDSSKPLRSDCAPPAIRSFCQSHSTGERPPTSAAPCALGPIPPTRRSILIAAPGTTRTSLWSTPLFSRRRQRSIRR